MKSLFGVLSLVIVLVYSQAEEPHGCNKTLGPEELHQVQGDWVMVWNGFDKTKSYDDLMPNITSCHMEIQVLSDNHTLTVHERYVYGGGKCASYKFNLTGHEGDHRLDMVGAVEIKDGEVKPYIDNATIEFFPSSEKSLELLFRSERFGFDLTIYRREGQHLNVLEKDHEEYRAMAKCLNLHDDNFTEWHYDGSDFCHKKSVLPTLDSDELQQMEGDWVLVWMAYNKIMDHDFPVENFASSHMEFHVHSDNHTVDLHERNVVGGKCKSFKGRLVLPQQSERIHRLHVESGTEIVDLVEKPHNDTAYAEIFPSSDNSMKMLYNSERHGHFLLIYRREGQHHDVKDLEKDYKEHEALAKYLGLSGNDFDVWHYNGDADFCHKKSMLPTLDSDELHQVEGAWGLVWMAYDKIKFPLENFTSSSMEVHVHSDNHTVDLHERNAVGEKCTSFKMNLVLPQQSERIHRLHLVHSMEITDGVAKLDNDTVTAVFFRSSHNSMKIFYKSEHHGLFLLIYRRQGHHQNVKDLEKEYEKYEALAKYLGLSGNDFDVWHYDGAADFCH